MDSLRYILTLLITFVVMQSNAQSTPNKVGVMCVGDTAFLSVKFSNTDSLQWYRNDVAVVGGNNDTLITLLDGDYYVRAFRGDCDDVSGYIFVVFNYPKLVDDYYLVPLTRNVVMNVLDNDRATCAPFDLKTLRIVSQPMIGTASVADDGTILYKPSISQLGTDHFTYEITDIEGRLASSALVTIDLDLNCAIVYPNPTHGLTHITVNNTKIIAFEVLDALGRLLYSKPVTSTTTTMDLSGMAQGIYMIRFIENDGLGCMIKVQKD